MDLYWIRSQFSKNGHSHGETSVLSCQCTSQTVLPPHICINSCVSQIRSGSTNCWASWSWIISWLPVGYMYIVLSVPRFIQVLPVVGPWLFRGGLYIQLQNLYILFSVSGLFRFYQLLVLGYFVAACRLYSYIFSLFQVYSGSTSCWSWGTSWLPVSTAPGYTRPYRRTALCTWSYNS